MLVLVPDLNSKVKDVLEIITVFSAKLHSMRSLKNVAALPKKLEKLARLEEKKLGKINYAELSNPTPQ